MTPKNRISLIAALGARTRAIGLNNDLIWRGLTPDMKHFKVVTLGHPVIMGRKTWESIPEKFRPLPGRSNIVVSRAATETPGAVACTSLENAIDLAKTMPGGEEIFIIGGGSIYEQALPIADRLYLTLIDDDAAGDTFFPEYEAAFTNVIQVEHLDFTPPLTFLTLGRP